MTFHWAGASTVKGDGVRLVSVDEHEDGGAIEVGMFAVNLRERAREIVGKNAIADAHGPSGPCRIHAPSFLVDSGPRQRMMILSFSGEFLDVLGKIINRIAPGCPRRQNEGQITCIHVAGNDFDFDEVRCRALHAHSVGEFERQFLGTGRGDDLQRAPQGEAEK